MGNIYHRSGDILCILNILKKYTDSNNLLPISKIKELVQQEYGNVIEDRTIRRDINLLIEKFNYDISTYNDNKKGYCLNKDLDLDFEKGEIRIILDIFNYSPIIAQNFAKQTLKKVKNMQSEIDNEELDSYVAFMKNNKTENYDVIGNIESIVSAIGDQKKIEFEYYKYGLDKKLHRVGKYLVSPYALIYEEQSYYLVAIEEGEKDFYTYRLDRIKGLGISEEKISIDRTQKDIENFVTSMIYAFGGKKEKVKLLCHNRLINAVIDKFGRDVVIKKYDEDHFILEADKCIYGIQWWLKYNLEDCFVLEPTYLKDEMIELFEKSIKRYKEVAHE